MSHLSEARWYRDFADTGSGGGQPVTPLIGRPSFPILQMRPGYPRELAQIPQEATDDA